MAISSLNRFKKAYTAYHSGDAAYDHWTPEEAKKLETAIAEKTSWLDANMSRVKSTLKTKDLPIKAAAFLSEQQVYYLIFFYLSNDSKATTDNMHFNFIAGF